MKILNAFLLALFCSTGFLANAQFSLGIKGGYTTAWEYYALELPEDAPIRVNGLNLSAMAHYGLGKHFKLGLEPGFVQRGAACVPGWQPVFEGDTKLLLNYAEAPLLVSFGIPLLKDRLEVFGKAGYGASCLVSAYEQLTVLGREDPEPREQVALGKASRLNRWDHGAYSALGLGLQVGPGQLLLETDLYLGMRNAERLNVSKNRSLSFCIGYMIRI